MSNMSMHSSFESKFDEPSDVLKWAEEMQQKFGDEFRCPRLDFSSPWNLMRNTIGEFGMTVWDPTYPRKEAWLFFFAKPTSENVIWKAQWMPLKAVWLKQFIPPTHNMQESDFSYDPEDCQGKKRQAVCAWKSVRKIKTNDITKELLGQGNKTNSDTWRFDPIPMTYTKLLPQLIQNRQLAPIPMIPIQSPYPKWYDSNAGCDYHAGGAGHSTENCLALKRNVQSLINAGWLSFKKSDEKPNVNENPLPNHENPKVNVVDGLVEKCKNEVYEIVMPMEALFAGLFEAGYVSHEYLGPNIRYEGYDESRHCIFHQGVAGHVVQQCQKFRSKVQQLMNSEILTVITGPSVDNITGISGITQSGRCYKSDNFTVPSDGIILEQEPHRKMLLDILNKAHVGHDISVEKFSGIIGNITSSNSIVFTDDEIPPEGLSHTKALHIQVKCKDYVIARVLVDNGSTLNIMPKSTLLKLPVDMSHIKLSTMVVKAFDGSRREVMGDIELPVKIGPCIFNIVFQVMEITPTYSFLLGRPWIHSVGVVPSTLHQKLKFIVGSKLICAMGEEDFLITKPVSTPYVEAMEEALEHSFRSFEIAHATMMEVTVDEVIKPHKSKVEVMTTRIMGGGGYSLNQNLETLLKTPSLV
ncbi:Gag-pro-like protein [Cucumis melo var. makuwa]|uniref:Gag-pro-like protein n=1 Tax=Cucumis melo var. makuwa TaxID=1194695 RepID=A0A5D3BBJ5_CUCMM|nr:Gag-pro-like protein [Cucumis melo var. makuwa]TYJ96379.1 Gag-pro-like protein [Cucumis melo var. makuwa]